MDLERATELRDHLRRLFAEELVGAFPYEDSRRLQAQAGGGYGDLVPDLSAYFRDIAMHCAAARKMFRWPPERLAKSQLDLSRTFFERHPRYEPLQRFITEENTPALYRRFLLHERAKQEVLDLLRLLATRPLGGAQGGAGVSDP